MKRTLHVSTIRRSRVHGFFARTKKILAARRKKGRVKLTV